jgi:membrane protease YdiL (CAAX protease family)
MSEPAAASLPPTPTPNDRRALGLEACVVFGATAGVSLLGALWAGGTRTEAAFTNAHLLGLTAYELLLALLLVPWLGRRGWSPYVVGGTPAPSDVVRGAGVALLAYACYGAVWVLFAGLQPETAAALVSEHRYPGAPAGAVVIVAVSLVNPVFEEFLWLGYGVARLGPQLGMRVAATLSLTLRVAVHAYQGPWAVLSILPLGLAFTWYYGRSRRIWPVVVAHVMFDALGLAQRLAAGQ